jgi:hypothetical protein
MVYNAAAKVVGVSIRPMGRGSNRVRGGAWVHDIGDR